MVVFAIETKRVKSPKDSVLVIDARHVAALTEPQVVAAIVSALGPLSHPFTGIVVTGPTGAMSAMLMWKICPVPR
jgi:hypothetical protein